MGCVRTYLQVDVSENRRCCHALRLIVYYSASCDCLFGCNNPAVPQYILWRGAGIHVKGGIGERSRRVAYDQVGAKSAVLLDSLRGETVESMQVYVSGYHVEKGTHGGIAIGYPSSGSAPWVDTDSFTHGWGWSI